MAYSRKTVGYCVTSGNALIRFFLFLITFLFMRMTRAGDNENEDNTHTGLLLQCAQAFINIDFSRMAINQILSLLSAKEAGTIGSILETSQRHSYICYTCTCRVNQKFFISYEMLSSNKECLMTFFWLVNYFHCQGLSLQRCFYILRYSNRLHL